MTRPTGAAALRTLATVLISAVITAGAAAAAEDLIIEGEEYQSYGWHDLGGVAIHPEYCSGASGYYAASGLDVPGEWIRLKITIPVDGCYRTTIAYQSEYSDHVQLLLRVADAPGPGQELTSEYWLTEGYGFG